LSRLAQSSWWVAGALVVALLAGCRQEQQEAPLPSWLSGIMPPAQTDSALDVQLFCTVELRQWATFYLRVTKGKAGPATYALVTWQASVFAPAGVFPLKKPLVRKGKLPSASAARLERALLEAKVDQLPSAVDRPRGVIVDGRYDCVVFWQAGMRTPHTYQTDAGAPGKIRGHGIAIKALLDVARSIDPKLPLCD